MIILGSIWDHFTIILEFFWDHFGIILGSFWDHFRIISGSFWDHFEIILESFCDHFGIILQSFWHHFKIPVKHDFPAKNEMAGFTGPVKIPCQISAIIPLPGILGLPGPLRFECPQQVVVWEQRFIVAGFFSQT